MRAAKIVDGIVTDIWIVPYLLAYKEHTLVEAPDYVSVGWVFDGAGFTNPNAKTGNALLLEVKERKREVATGHFRGKLLELTRGVAPAELSLNYKLNAEITEFKNNPNAKVPTLEAIASKRGKSVNKQVETLYDVLSKLEKDTAELIGSRQAVYDLIDAATSVEEVESITF